MMPVKGQTIPGPFIGCKRAEDLKEVLVTAKEPRETSMALGWKIFDGLVSPSVGERADRRFR
jgi:hypothetical protein